MALLRPSKSQTLDAQVERAGGALGAHLPGMVHHGQWGELWLR